MTKHKFTPGEWVFMTDETFYGEIRSVDTFELIAVMPDLDDRPEDFQLIAAAPKLLEVLETVVNNPLGPWYDKARQAIAMALGEDWVWKATDAP